MNLRMLILGILIGAGLFAALFFGFADEYRSDLAQAAHEVGSGVKEVGETIEKAGSKLR